MKSISSSWFHYPKFALNLSRTCTPNIDRWRQPACFRNTTGAERGEREDRNEKIVGLLIVSFE